MIQPDTRRLQDRLARRGLRELRSDPETLMEFGGSKSAIMRYLCQNVRDMIPHPDEVHSKVRRLYFRDLRKLEHFKEAVSPHLAELSQLSARYGKMEDEARKHTQRGPRGGVYYISPHSGHKVWVERAPGAFVHPADRK